MPYLRLAKGVNEEHRYCYNPDCKTFGDRQTFLYADATYDHPSEWIEEPECRECNGETYQEAPSLAQALDRIVNDVPDDPMSAEDKALFKAAIAWARKEEMI